MGIWHPAIAGLPSDTAAGKVGGADYKANHVHVPFEVSMFRSAAATAPAAASAAVGAEVFAAAKATRTRTDLLWAREVQLCAMVVGTGTDVAASLKLSYMTTETATWAGTDAGASVVLGTNGGAAGVIHTSGWRPLATAAQVDAVTIACLVGTVFGTTAPTIGSLYALFR